MLLLSCNGAGQKPGAASSEVKAAISSVTGRGENSLVLFLLTFGQRGCLQLLPQVMERAVEVERGTSGALAHSFRWVWTGSARLRFHCHPERPETALFPTTEQHKSRRIGQF